MEVETRVSEQELVCLYTLPTTEYYYTLLM